MRSRHPADARCWKSPAWKKVRVQVPQDTARDIPSRLIPPLWWFGAPAMLKGWMDRVLVYGGLYSSEQRFEQGVCRGKKVLLCVTTGSSAHECAPNGREGNTHLLLWPIQYAFRYVGFDVLQSYLVHGIWADCTASGRDLNEELRRYSSFCADIDQAAVLRFNSPPIGTSTAS
ncbi:NAD(P)H-dependent oxidoreductase [Pseudomonas fluorescens]|uniref:NAD(P)H-dependent oxidoreductase n=1 Tax=Pseudomonas fluorescens TaxID=294 RepID=UPI002966D82B|nr:NAD(P)H-dependent oxidoreductase [Pseudomonas fluorescens]